MFWFQNLVIIVVSYLISRMIIEDEIHTYLISKLIERSKKDPSFLLSGILFLSYFFSIFLSNTVVIIAFIPIIKGLLKGIKDKVKRSLLTTNLVLALIYGANIGGMASLTGSAFNVLYIGFLEINTIPGRESINFFTWFIFGIPLTLIHLLLAKFILHLGSKHVPYNEVVYNNSEIEKPQKFRKQVVFAVVNILFMFILSGIQFTLKPSPIFLKFNVIDLIFIIYLFLFIVFSFILPTGELKWRKFLRNFSYFILFIALFPLIALIEILREVRSRFKLSGEKLTRDLDNFLLNIFRKTWLWLHREKMDSLKKKNREQFISINRLIYDLPFFGLFFIGVLLAAIYFMLKWGDNPATTINDGHVFVFLKDFLSNLHQEERQYLLYFSSVLRFQSFYLK